MLSRQFDHLVFVLRLNNEPAIVLYRFTVEFVCVSHDCYSCARRQRYSITAVLDYAVWYQTPVYFTTELYLTFIVENFARWWQNVGGIVVIFRGVTSYPVDGSIVSGGRFDRIRWTVRFVRYSTMRYAKAVDQSRLEQVVVFVLE